MALALITKLAYVVGRCIFKMALSLGRAAVKAATSLILLIFTYRDCAESHDSARFSCDRNHGNADLVLAR